MAPVEHGRQRARADEAILERVAEARRRLRAVGDAPTMRRSARARGPRRSSGGRRRPAARCRGKAAGSWDWRTPAPAAAARRAAGVAARSRSARIALRSVARCMTARSMSAHSPRIDRQRDQIHRPGPRVAVRIAVDVVGDAVGLDQPLADFPAPRELRVAHAPERRQRGAPSGGAAAPDASSSFVPVPVLRRLVAPIRDARVARDCGVCVAHGCGRRGLASATPASSAADRAWSETRDSSAGVGVNAWPGVWPNGEEPRTPPGLGFVRVHRKRLVAASAGMGHVIGAAADRPARGRDRPDRTPAACARGSSGAGSAAAARRGSGRRTRTRPAVPVGCSGSRRPLQVTA